MLGVTFASGFTRIDSKRKRNPDSVVQSSCAWSQLIQYGEKLNKK